MVEDNEMVAIKVLKNTFFTRQHKLQCPSMCSTYRDIQGQKFSVKIFPKVSHT